MRTGNAPTLFIAKRFYDYNGVSHVSNGLKRSAQFIVDLLQRNGRAAQLAEAVDGNCVDRLVTEAGADRVVIEALWVTPAKMAELQRLHPAVEWTVRIHSELPFLAGEGIAVEWIVAYRQLGIDVAFNSPQTTADFDSLIRSVYLPNWYPLRHPRPRSSWSDTLDIGCFGAIRPLKNQLVQAFAAVRYAAGVERALVFHMNGTRVEQGGQNVLRQIEALMGASGNRLVLHPWLDHEPFLALVASMDICLQVSLSETFNIVSADAVSMGVPLVGSDAIRWLPKRARALADSTESICAAMERADATTVAMNHDALERYLEGAEAVWLDWVK